jgi:hypothetical protein
MIDKDWHAIPVKGMIDPAPYTQGPPKERGKLNYDKRGELTHHEHTEMQVNGSVARYGIPLLRPAHQDIQQAVQKIIGEKLYPTYYYDRFYFRGQELARHTDRGACEISVTVNISHNLDYDWPIYFELPGGEVREFVMQPGDGVIYHGITLPHWREPMRGGADSYFHQCFFHYVRADGDFLQHAFDMGGPG